MGYVYTFIGNFHKSIDLSGCANLAILGEFIIYPPNLSTNEHIFLKVLPGTHDRIYKLLEILPTRGPGCFGKFIEVLIECDHKYVAEHLQKQSKQYKF